MFIYDPIWEDRHVKFDLSQSAMNLRTGEMLIDKITSVEDTKGNNGERGRILITNLRIIWHAIVSPRINISIGLNTISSITRQLAASKLRGSTEAIYILAKFNAVRFEFIFTNLVQGSPRLFSSINTIHSAYQSSKLYRDLRLRSPILDTTSGSCDLNLLPNEELYETIQGVWNLSSEQGNLGAFHVTNVRLVWHALPPKTSFNISVPWIQIKSIKLRKSKFGQALVVEISQTSGGYVLGFKVDPETRLNEVHRQLCGVQETSFKYPEFGIIYNVETPAATENASEGIPQNVDDVEIESTGQDVLAAYISEPTTKRPVVFNEDIGLAIEQLKEGFTLQSLWQIQ